MDLQEHPPHFTSNITLTDMDNPYGNNFRPLQSDIHVLQSDIHVLLTKWNLSHLATIFEENSISPSGIKNLTEDEIKELIPKIGDRGIFREQRTYWIKTQEAAESVVCSLLLLVSVNLHFYY